MLNFAEQTGSGVVIVVWSFLTENGFFFIYIVHAPTCLQHLQGWQGSGREGLDCEGVWPLSPDKLFLTKIV
jgi:hypothetical protein